MLDRAVDAIGRDIREHGPAALTVTLGDYIDRGPSSRGVLDRLAGNPFPTPHVALKGNHEALLESFLADPQTGPHWRRLGGLETLHSYDVPVRGLLFGKGYEEAAALLREAMGRHLDFVRSLKTSFSYGKYFLCHAGVRPGIALESQKDEDLLWIRDEFLHSEMDFGKIVVHGHTPVSAPEGAVKPDQYRHRRLCQRAIDVCGARGRRASLSQNLIKSRARLSKGDRARPWQFRNLTTAVRGIS
ncbi:MAG: metallophosphoesterase [Pseudolabrys sp.]